MKYILFVIILLSLFQVIREISFLKDSGIKSHIIVALFLLKSLVGILYTYIYARLYGATNVDVFNYFNDGIVVTSALKTDFIIGMKLFFWHGQEVTNELQPYFDKTGYFSNSGDFFIIRLHALLNFISGAFIYTHILIFNFLSLIGIVGIYKLFQGLFREYSSLGFVLLALFPSILIFGSGLHKESILLFLLGCIAFTLTKRSILTVGLSIISILLMFELRSYFVGILFVASVFLLVDKLLNKGLTLSLCVYLFLLCIAGVVIGDETLSIINKKRMAFQGLSSGNSSFYMLPANSSFPMVLFHIPETVFNGLFRPSLYPFKSFMNMILGGLNLFYLIFLVYTLFNFNRKNLANSLLFSIICSVLVFLSIALVVNNEGAIARYKMQMWLFLIPFFMHVFPKGTFDKVLLKKI